MQIILAENAGFCYGVKRAVDLALRALSEQGPHYSLGPLVHNREVTGFLSGKGLTVQEDIALINDGTVVLPSHGVPPDILETAQTKGLSIIDATCPKVRKVQELARKLTEDGYQVIVIGNSSHPEICGIKGWTGNKALVAASWEDIAQIPVFDRIAVLSQTTIKESLFLEMAGALISHAGETRIFNTICQVSSKKQEAASELASRVEAMVVVGDRSSSNTKSLVKVCEASGVPTYFVENAYELRADWFQNKDKVGVITGASTPDWLIKEVIDRMSDLETNALQDEQNSSMLQKPAGEENISPSEDKNEVSFAELEAEMAESLKEVEKGTILKGTVIQVGPDEVMVDVGGKSEGIIPLRELSLHKVEQASDVVKVGDEVTVMVLRWEDDGTILVSKRRVDQEKCLDMIEEAFAKGEPIKGKALRTVKGGLLVDVGIPGFLPASQLDGGFKNDLEAYIGKELLLDIIEFNRNKRRGSQIILTRRKQAEIERQEAIKKFWEEIVEGQTRVGKVKRVTEYGAFVDIGGFEGLLHISEIDHFRVDKPSDVLTVGQEIEVSIIGVDPKTRRISLSRKKIIPSPWETVTERFQVGSIVTGKVVRIAPFGAFVELEPGIDGLVHISQLSDHRVAKTEDAVQVGQEVMVKILSIDAGERRIGLSIKEALTGMDDQYIASYLENQ